MNTPPGGAALAAFRLDDMEIVQREFAPFLEYLEAARATLMTGRRVRGRRAALLRAAVGHALAFTTWRSLVREQDCTATEAVGMMCRLVDG